MVSARRAHPEHGVDHPGSAQAHSRARRPATAEAETEWETTGEQRSGESEPEAESEKTWGLTTERQGGGLVGVAVLGIGGGCAGILLAALDTLERHAVEVAARNHLLVPPFLT